MNTSNKNEFFDLLVVGAGVAGCAVAFTCVAEGKSCALLNFDSPLERYESLSPDTCRRLSKYSAEIGAPFANLFAWWGTTKKSVSAVDGARIVERRALAARMRETVNKVVKILICKPRLAIAGNANAWTVSYSDDRGIQVLNAKHLCDATGRRCVVARSLGIKRKIFDKLCCISVLVEGFKEPGTFTESVPSGWWNLCNDGQAGTLSFYSSPSIIKKASRGLKHFFQETKEIKKLVRFDDKEKSSVSVCGSSILTSAAGPGWFAVGDAAATFQPLASTGIAKAMRDSKNIQNAILDPVSYDSRYQVEFDDYLKNLRMQYRLEKRWPNHDLWQ